MAVDTESGHFMNFTRRREGAKKIKIVGGFFDVRWRS
jgi:hypothetical protein